MSWAKAFLSFAAVLLLAGAALSDEADEVFYSGFDESDLPEARNAARHFDEGQCDKAWTVLQNLLGDGKLFAGTALAYEIFFVGLVPPGSSPDRVSQLRHLIVLSSYGAASGDASAIELYRKVSTVISGGNDTYLRCLEGGSREASECFNDHIRAGMLPSIQDYFRELDSLSAALNLPARCIPNAAFWPNSRSE